MRGAMKQFRKLRTLSGLSVREMIEEGRSRSKSSREGPRSRRWPIQARPNGFVGSMRAGIDDANHPLGFKSRSED